MRMDDRGDLLRRIPLFAELSDAELARLAGDFRRHSFSAGQTIFYQGDPGAALYVVESGLVRIYVHAEDGQEVSVALYGPGELFGEMALLDRQPRSATAVAMEDSLLLTMNSEAFSLHLHENYQLALNLMLILSMKLRETTKGIKSLVSLDVSRRIIQKLLQMARQQGVTTAEGLRLRDRLTQQDLASLVGATRESVNRALRALVRKELVALRHGHIVILQLAKLEQLIGEEEV